MRFLILAGVTAGLVCTGLAAAYSSGVLDLVKAGYPPPVWPASGPFEIVDGAVQARPNTVATGQLTPRGQELFETSEGKALVVFQDGEPVLETYADDFGPDTRFNSYSLIKSLVGALVLSAVTEGKITSLDEPLGRYLPDYGPDDFRKIPLRDFLEMRSGLDFERDGADKRDRLSTLNPFGNLARLHAGGLDAVEQGLIVLPQSRGQFAYQNVNTAVLGRVLAAVNEKPLSDLLKERIWQPAGASDAFWLRYAAGEEVTAYCCLFATPGDWAKVATYLMRNGSPDTPLMRADLWQAYFGVGLSPAELASGSYGFHIRHDILDRPGEALQGPFSYMMGQGGQTVYMMPDKNLVVVRFGNGNALLHSTLYEVWNSLPTRE